MSKVLQQWKDIGKKEALDELDKCVKKILKKIDKCKDFCGSNHGCCEDNVQEIKEEIDSMRDKK